MDDTRDIGADTPVDSEKLRREVSRKYREVAIAPDATYHFHTGRKLAARLGYDAGVVDSLPDAAVESFAGVANPFTMRVLEAGETVVDAGATGAVVGIDMTAEMLAKSRATAREMGAATVEFREGLLEDMPVADGWADVVISNGVFNLCADKRGVFSEVMRVLRPGGVLQFADIANGKPVPEEAIRDIDLWTA